MRSLVLKLTLAFLFVSVIGAVLTAVIVRQRTQREFDRFVLDRYQADLIQELTTYYEQNGSWQDINAIVIRGPARPGHVPATYLAPIALIDPEGSVIYGGRRFQVGQRLTRAELEKAVPVEIDEETVGWVLFPEPAEYNVPQPESPESRFIRSLNLAVIFGALGSIAVALLLGVVLARTISRPIKEVTAATQIVAGGDLGYQVPVRTRDELGELAASFNRMSADLAWSNDQRRQMTADIAHDLRTPLSVILGYMEAFSTGKLQATPETLAIMYAKGQQLQHLIDDLRVLALADAGELSLTRRLVEPAALLEHTALAHQVQATEKQIRLRVEAGEALPEIHVDPERMAQVLGNLVENALRHTPEGGEIVLAARREAQAVSLTVRDTGPGIAPEDLPYIFNRFYRGDRARQQNGESGLGLAIAQSIVKAHGGTIAAESIPPNGATISITIPLNQ